MKKKHTYEEVVAAISKSNSLKELMSNLGWKVNGGNYRRVKLYVELYGLTAPVFDYSQATKQAKNINKIPNDKYFSIDTYHNGPSIKKRLIEDFDIKEVCLVCEIGPEWNGKILVLQVDHINGNRYDNRIENLRLLCPNCHTQTDNFSNNGIVARYYYCECGSRINKVSKRCHSCASLQKKKSKIDWPRNEELLTRLETSNYTRLGKELGVSGSAIIKRLNKHRGIV